MYEVHNLCDLAQYRGMDWDDYLRDEGRKYRKLAEETDDPLIKQELLELADILRQGCQ
jgi:hypothetical protein